MEFKIHVHHHGDDAQLEALAIVQEQLTSNRRIIMSALTELKAVVEEIHTAVDDVAADVDALLNRVPDEGGMTAAEVAELKASLTSASDKAKAAAAKFPGAPPVDPPPA